MSIKIYIFLTMVHVFDMLLCPEIFLMHCLIMVVSFKEQLPDKPSK